MIIAGGVESLSDIPILHSRRFSRILVEAGKAQDARRPAGRARQGCARATWCPVTPAIAEPSTGQTMGQSAEKMAKENGITPRGAGPVRAASHQRAAAATADGRLTAEIAPWFGGTDDGQVIDGATTASAPTPRIEAARASSSRSSTAATARVTAGNSSPLTDGAAAVLLMTEEKARALGYAPLAYIRSYAVTRRRSGWQLLMGPAYAVPMALERAGISLGTSTSWRCTRRSPRRCSRTSRPGARTDWAERARPARARWARSIGSGST